MIPEIVVFLGPSLAPETAAGILPADYRPPAKRGDITDAARGGARIITLIDGVFFQDCSVGHREILAALQGGARVIGASSMGALRAAELDTLGMEGVGRIYRLYRDGVLTSDDEVALVFDPETGIALSEPLINIRCTLAKAEEEGVIGHEAGSILLATAQSLYFPDRTWETILASTGPGIKGDELHRLRDFVRDHAVDQKQHDAEEALLRTRDLARELGIPGC
jgi:hypothetical protein